MCSNNQTWRNDKWREPILSLRQGGSAFASLWRCGNSFRMGFRDSRTVNNQALLTSQHELTLKTMKEHFNKLSQIQKDHLIHHAVEDWYGRALLLACLRTYVNHLDNRILKHECLGQQLQHRRTSIDFLDEMLLNLLFHQNVLIQRPTGGFTLLWWIHPFGGLTPTNSSRGFLDETVPIASIPVTLYPIKPSLFAMLIRISSPSPTPTFDILQTCPW